jgi:toxin-antitoxin system PIN domain toxin
VRGLLDVNVLIALLDADHVMHDRAHAWWSKERGKGWASCPITENGVIRIMSNPAYSRKRTIAPAEVILKLGQFAENTDHEFWVDDVSFRDAGVFNLDFVVSSTQVTDLYLLALAAKNGGRLVTFDTGITLAGVKRAPKNALCVI